MKAAKRKKQRIYRILIGLVAFLVLFVLEHTGRLANLSGFGLFILYFLPYLVVGYDVIVRAAKNISHGQIFDENFLMMIATFAAFGLGALGDVQYEEALAVMLFYQIGEAFQDHAVGKSRASIAEMMDIAPEYAYVLRDGELCEVDPDEVAIGEEIVIRPGDRVPLDGTVLSGSSWLDTAALTGESVPRRASVGDAIYSGAVNGEGTLHVRVSKAYEDSTVARILDLVENASASKARIENFITRFARYYTPIVTVGAALLALALPLLLGMPWAEGIERACNFLIVSCPCALVISVPLGFYGGIGAASQIGVLVKGSNYLEVAAQLDTVVTDKTGTLTEGVFHVNTLEPSPELIASCGGEDEAAQQLLEWAAYGESLSTHPIAQSVLTAYGRDIDAGRIAKAGEIAGRGTAIECDGEEILCGSRRLMEERGVNYTPSAAAGTLVYVAHAGRYAGCIVIADTIKDSAPEAIRALHREGIRTVVMLTGDRAATADAVAEALGIDQVHSELLPADKVSVVEQLLAAQASGGGGSKLAFVGDGINDAPVLMRADVGIAMGSLGSDAAIEAADIVLMDDDIAKIPVLLRIARKTVRIVRSNVVFALAVKIAILLLSAVGIATMWAAVFGDVGVCVLCILNAMRALRTR